jgi:hypothetical protein
MIEPPYIRFYANKLIMWAIGGTKKSVEKEESILKIAHRFRSGVIGESEID